MESDISQEHQNPVVIPDAPMTFEEADVILKENHELQKKLDNVYPWWETFRWPMVGLSAAFIIIALSVIFLSLTLLQATGNRDREYREDACFDQYNVLNDEAVARVRASATAVDNFGWTAVINSQSGIEVTQEVVDTQARLVAESERALEIEAKRVVERQEWIDAGRPLPCPVS